MITQIICQQCAANQYPFAQEDVLDGWKRRERRIKVQKPEDFNLEIDSFDPVTGAIAHTIIPVPIVVCDLCNVALPDGTTAVATTQYQGEEPEEWEHRYGEILS